jgi:hypothetical protein
VVKWTLDEDKTLMEEMLRHKHSSGYRSVDGWSPTTEMYKLVEEEFVNRTYVHIRDRWMRYVKPVLADPGFARLEPEGILEFEMDLLEVVLEGGANSYKEVLTSRYIYQSNSSHFRSFGRWCTRNSQPI